jgi:hypothetical protein
MTHQSRVRASTRAQCATAQPTSACVRMWKTSPREGRVWSAALQLLGDLTRRELAKAVGSAHDSGPRLYTAGIAHDDEQLGSVGNITTLRRRSPPGCPSGPLT